jgi:hypothetical protein
MKIQKSHSYLASIGALIAACGAAQAQYTFETPTYTGSAAGTIVTGQDGWYLPPVAGSQDGNVFSYTGNALGFPPNPNGSGQFEGGQGNATGPARAQHTLDFSAGGVWQASWDCTGRWNGAALPAVNNIGSWSMQPSAAPPFAARYFQQLMSWGGAGNNYQPAATPPTDHLAAADFFHIHWGYFTAASPATIAFSVPGPEWLDLPVGHWYHITCKWDFTAAQILEVSIKDLTANGPTTTSDVTSLGWYLQGGPNSTNPLPTDIRIFAGGAGDASAWDNLIVQPVAQTCYANCDGSSASPILNANDFQCFLNAYATASSLPNAQQITSYANCDQSSGNPALNANDFQCFLNKFAVGCS